MALGAPKLGFGKNELSLLVKLCLFPWVLQTLELLKRFPVLVLFGCLLLLIRFPNQFVVIWVLEKSGNKTQIPHLFVFHLECFYRNQDSLVFIFSYGRSWTSLRDKIGIAWEMSLFSMYLFESRKDDRYHLFSFRSPLWLRPPLFQCGLHPYTATYCVRLIHFKCTVCIKAAQDLQLE